MRRLAVLAAALLLTACVSADPAVVSRAVQATLAAMPTPTPIVVVVTVVRRPDGVPTATPPPPTETAAPEPTAAPTTPAPADAAAPTGLPAFADDFSQPGAWSLGEDAVQRTELADGQFAFTLKEPDQFRFIYDVTRRARNFHAALTGRGQACRFRDRYGLIFRVQDSANYYQFEVDCDGRYRLAKVVDGTLTALKDWTPDPAVAAGPGAVNALAVRAEGDRLAVFVNGARVFEAADASFAEGSFGLYVGSSPAAGFTALFDDFRVWALP